MFWGKGEGGKKNNNTEGREGAEAELSWFPLCNKVTEQAAAYPLCAVKGPKQKMRNKTHRDAHQISYQRFRKPSHMNIPADTVE